MKLLRFLSTCAPWNKRRKPVAETEPAKSVQVPPVDPRQAQRVDLACKILSKNTRLLSIALAGDRARAWLELDFQNSTLEGLQAINDQLDRALELLREDLEKAIKQ